MGRTDDVLLEVEQDSIQAAFVEVARNEGKSVRGQGRETMDDTAHLVSGYLGVGGGKTVHYSYQQLVEFSRRVEWTKRNTQEFNMLCTEPMRFRCSVL